MMCSLWSRFGEAPHRWVRTIESMPSAPTSSGVAPSRRSEGEQHVGAAVLDAEHLLAGPQHALGQRREHPAVQVGAQQADEAAAVLVEDVLRDPHVRADMAARVLEGRVVRRADVRRVDADLPQRLQGRRPQVQDVPRRPRLPVALQDHDRLAHRVQRERGGHAGGAPAEHHDRIVRRRRHVLLLIESSARTVPTERPCL